MLLKNPFFYLLICCLFCSNALAKDEQFTSEQLEFFEKKIRPFFTEHCYECHGAETQEASLRLDSRQFVLKGGDTGPAVVPNQLDKSELYQALLYDPTGYQMPPDGKLPAEKIELVKQWIEMGAPWPAESPQTSNDTKVFDLEERAKHWSFQPLSNVTPPPKIDSQWGLNEIDHFILQRLREKELSPAVETDRRTWLRRVSLDVTGLPPTVDELNQFLADESDDAYEKVIDRLLDSSAFGERWGRHWLDIVRYAESRGHEFDFEIANAWQYRDYVIRAMNENVPYDQFVVEQIAGDLLTEQTSYKRRMNSENGANESILGTGFWLLGEWVHSPVDIRQEEADRFDNMIDVYSKAFLGITVACARCHDHKFDPIRQKDYYALQGYLQSSSYQQARFESMIQNDRVATALDQLRSKYREKLRASVESPTQTTIQDFTKYFISAHEFLNSHSPESNITMFENFESGTYEKWRVEGNAFGKIPQTQESIADYQGDVKANGKFFVNSHQKREEDLGDAATGKMISQEFMIDFDEIHFLIGGGKHPKQTCVNLVVGGKVIRSETGKNRNQMSKVIWNTEDLKEQKAHLEIIDSVTDGWGNIGADAFSFHKKSDSEKLLTRYAQENKLNPKRFKAWIDQLLLAKDHGSLLYSVFSPGKYTSDESVDDPKQFDSFFTSKDFISTGPGYRTVRKENSIIDSVLDENSSVPIAYAQNDFIQWGTVWNRLSEPSTNRGEPGNLENWQRGGRILRSPTFDIASGKIHCLVRGQVNTYVAVDTHILIRGPLHGKLTKQHPNQDEWHWITHDVSDYEGHNAHIEFVPVAGKDFAIQTVVQSDDLRSVKELFPVQSQSKFNQEVRSLTSDELSKRIKNGSLRNLSQRITDLQIAFPELFEEEATNHLQELIRSFLDELEPTISHAAFESATAPALLDGTGVDEYVFIRGNWKKKGDTVARRFLEVFNGEEANQAGSGRLQLAEQMVDPHQTPILPRVIVNRIWHHYFGRGLCPTPNDLGHLGQRPTHPELLDWLANELVKENWSIKAIHKKVLLSAAYRMSSQKSGDPRVREIDPNNQWLHRMNVKRLEGEAIRDSILSVSGSLNREMYGPSVPIHLTSFLEGRGRPGQSGPVDGHGRRSVYLSVRRNFPEPFFQAFDFPTPHSSIGRRNVSNVPAQALALMNNSMVVEQSQKWAENVLKKQPEASFEERIQLLYAQVFSRQPTHHEVELAQRFISGQMESLNLGEDSPKVWKDYCHVLLNSKEFIFVR